MVNPLTKKRIFPCIILIFVLCVIKPASAQTDDNIYEKRLSLYKKTASITQIPWYYLAAIDQYERNLLPSSESDRLISLSFPEALWFGIGNITKEMDERVIKVFGGYGRDGDGDKLADPRNEEDLLYSFAHYIRSYGSTRDDIKIALFNHYHRDLSVKTIMNTARVFKHFNTIHLPERAFPVPRHYNYSYRSTWGHRRGFGGLRMHEGTDIFASYGTPVLSTTYGVVELKGWNRFGGWRLGIRDINNIYHYFAHLNGYADDIEVGTIVQPGDVIGSVGSTGYGPPGTAGKFPPHLHYGMYKDNGYTEWSFDPYPYLRRWESTGK